MTIMFMIPAISPYTNMAAVFPLLFITIVAAFREIIEDFGRYKSDKQANQSQFLCVDNGKVSQKSWKDLIVGDLMLLKKEEVIPADILLLSSSNLDGSAFMQTSNLDGEKTLKPRNAIHQIFKAVGPLSPTLIPPKVKFGEINLGLDLQFNAHIEEPSISLYHFEGYMKCFTNGVECADPISLDTKSFLFKGARLKNTEWVLGMALYSGKHTKMQLNSGKARIKDSKLRKKMDICIGWLFIFQLSMSLFGVFGRDMIYLGTDGDFHAWIKANGLDQSGDRVLGFLKYAVILQFVIPISLIVAMEIVKFYQIVLMGWNEGLKSSSGKYCKVNTVTINEELGEVQYILSDKTGTLTVNKMEFTCCNILGNTFGGNFFTSNRQHVQFRNNLQRQNVKFEDCSLKQFDQKLYDVIHNGAPILRAGGEIDGLELGDSPSDNNVSNKNIPENGTRTGSVDTNETKNLPVAGEIKSYKFGTREFSVKEIASMFFLECAICNECLIERDEDGNCSYTSPSPDEIA
jgi:phospholipid-transporting ATPase